MKLRIANLSIVIGYEAMAAMTAVLLLDRDNRVVFCFLAALLHELGHILMMLLCHVRVRGIRLRLFDVLIEADNAPSVRADVLITVGGVVVNFLFAALLCPFGMKYGLPHLFLGVFNLLPVMSLDGGHLLEICLEKTVSPRTAGIVLRVTTFVFLLPLMTAGLVVLFNSGYNYSLLVISLYLTAVLFLKREPPCRRDDHWSSAN